MGEQPCRKAVIYTRQNKLGINADIHASSVIRNHDPTVLHALDHAATVVGTLDF
jgi:hypothetical protein